MGRGVQVGVVRVRVGVVRVRVGVVRVRVGVRPAPRDVDGGDDDLSPTTTTEDPPELQLELVVEERVDDGVEAAVAVADELQDDHGYPERRVGLHELLVQRRREEREPQHRESNNQQHQHFDHLPLLLDASGVAPRICNDVSDWLLDPQAMRNGAVRERHDKHRNQISADEYCQRKYFSVVFFWFGKGFHAHVADAEDVVGVKVYFYPRFDPLYDQLRADDTQRNEPDDNETQYGKSLCVYLSGYFRVTNNQIPVNRVKGILSMLLLLIIFKKSIKKD